MKRVWSAALVGTVGIALGGCGARSGTSSGHHVARTPPVSSSLKGGCQDVATNELVDVAGRVYRQAFVGDGAAGAISRLQQAPQLAAAVASGDRAAIEAAFLPLRHQIVRIQISRGARIVYRYGTFPTFAPLHGVLHGSDGRVAGRFVMAATDRRAYTGFVKRLTGADVVFRSAGAPQRRPGTRLVSLATQTYPAGLPLHIDLRIPTPSPTLCGATNAQTRLNTIGSVARRLLRAEGNSRDASQTINHVAKDPAFRAATASGDPKAIQAAIVHDFFRDHSLHIVRVRVLRGTRVLYDLGGPYVLQPVTGTVRSPDGRSAATFLVAVQDDTGFIKLVHRFTGADVQLVSPLGPVPGSSLTPGPAVIPPHGSVLYRGHRYLTDSFDGVAFPSGILRVSILVPAGRPGSPGTGPATAP